MTENNTNDHAGHILGQHTDTLKLESLNDNAHHVTAMSSQATRHLRIFSRDLDARLFDNAGFMTACKALALHSRFSRIEILLIESRQVTAHGHRLLNLAKTLSSRIEIRQPEKQYEKLRHFSLTVDGQGYVYRTMNERYEGLACYHDPRYCRELDRHFTEIWQRSHVDAELRNMRL